MDVTGIDPAIKMLNIAMNIPDNKGVEFIHANALEGLPFESKSFDVAIASYVAHGIVEEDRRNMYYEMSRIAKHYVVIHDYSDDKSLMTSIIEWLEGGDYFRFIENAEKEMTESFSEVKVIKVGFKVNWYICKPML